MRKLIDLTGKTYGLWLVLNRSGLDNQNKPMWTCLCQCGNEKIVNGSNLRQGLSKDCGCGRKESVGSRSVTHGKSKTPEYLVWQNMIKRCYNPKSSYYEDYGGRGISVSDKWRKDFSCFFNDLGERPSPTHSLDRIDVNGNYEPSNCRWTTASIQAYNQRKKKNNSSGVTGVQKGNGKWVALITKERKRILLGTFENFEDAVEVRKQAEIKYWGHKPSG